jgi:uncharacterized protein (DUF1778 family)
MVECYYLAIHRSKNSNILKKKDKTQFDSNTTIEKYNSILASRQDRELFFDALMNPQEPNDNLKKAASRFNREVTGK